MVILMVDLTRVCFSTRSLAGTVGMKMQCLVPKACPNVRNKLQQTHTDMQQAGVVALGTLVSSLLN